MSALLCASILSRGLTPEERREERERIKLCGGSGGGNGGEAGAARTARMLSALDAAEEDLRSEAVPIRARGVVTLTRCDIRIRCSSAMRVLDLICSTAVVRVGGGGGTGVGFATAVCASCGVGAVCALCACVYARACVDM